MLKPQNPYPVSFTTDPEKSSVTEQSKKGETREQLADDFGTNSNYVSQAPIEETTA